MCLKKSDLELGHEIALSSLKRPNSLLYTGIGATKTFGVQPVYSANEHLATANTAQIRTAHRL